MTRLIERQRISRRAPIVDLSEVYDDPPNARPARTPRSPPIRFRINWSSYRSIARLVLYSAIAIAGVIALFLIVGVGLSVSRPAVANPELPNDDMADALIFAYAYEGDTLGELSSTTPATAALIHFEPIAYTVRRGDTVSEIASFYDIRLDTIISYNEITDVRGIQAGAVVQIPAFDGEQPIDGVVYTVRRGDTLGGISEKHGVDLPPILDANRIESDVIRPGDVLFIPDASMNNADLRRALGTLFIRPVGGRMTSPFGPRIDPKKGTRSMHYGIDWANPTGTPVRASNHGTVSFVGNSRIYGNHIVIDHRDNFETLYAHLSAISVGEGQRVEQGAIIGKVGNTGYSTGAHLHFTIYKNHDPVDPLGYVH